VAFVLVWLRLGIFHPLDGYGYACGDERQGGSKVARFPVSGDAYCAPPVVEEVLALWGPQGRAHPARAGKETTRTCFRVIR